MTSGAGIASRLSAATLAQAGRHARLPEFDRNAGGVGQVHLGVGAFFKAHLAQYTQTAMERAGGDWGVSGVSLRSPGVRDALAPQDSLFSVMEKDGSGASFRIVGILKNMLVAPENAGAVVAAIADPGVKIVTLTITEKGYCLDPAADNLNFDHPDIRYDLENPASPRTAIGFLAAALKERFEARAPLTVVSCDNLSGNGARLKRGVEDFISEAGLVPASTLDELIRFPSTMVDRITPATTDDDLDEIEKNIGLRDEAAVVTEPFTQWVIEDDFAGDRPRWEEGGAVFVSDVAPYELAKLRLLNGAHSSIAYLGYLAGHEFVSDAMADDDLASFIEALQKTEIAPTLSAPKDLPLGAYIGALLQRFRNPALRHRTWQIAMDGSQKLPQRLLDTVRCQLDRDGPLDRLSLAIAAWTQYVSSVDEKGHAIDVRDPLAERLKALGAAAGDDPQERARAFLGVREVFGADLIQSPRFLGALARAIDLLRREGAAAAVRRYNKEGTL